MRVYIILVLILILIFIYNYSITETKKTITSSNVITEQPIIKKNLYNGRYELKSNEKLIKPFMIRNKCKKYVNNEGCWNLNNIKNNKYNLMYNDIYLYSDDTGVCFYKENETEEKSCKNVCSSEKLFNEETDYMDNEFYIESITDTLVSIKDNKGKYLCIENNKLISSNSPCTLELHPL